MITKQELNEQKEKIVEHKLELLEGIIDRSLLEAIVKRHTNLELGISDFCRSQGIGILSEEQMQPILEKYRSGGYEVKYTIYENECQQSAFLLFNL